MRIKLAVPTVFFRQRGAVQPLQVGHQASDGMYFADVRSLGRKLEQRGLAQVELGFYEYHQCTPPQPRRRQVSLDSSLLLSPGP